MWSDNKPMTVRTSLHRAVAQPSRLKVLDAILSQPRIGVAQLAEITGLHPNTLREHLTVLESTGFVAVEPEHCGSRGRPRSLYRPAAEPGNPVLRRRIDAAARHGDLLRSVLMPGLGTALPPAANRQLDAVWEHLDELGLDPDVDEESLVIDLDRTDYDALGEKREVVCHVQSELVRGILECAGGPVHLSAVEEGRDAHGCRLRLALAEGPGTCAGTAGCVHCGDQ